MHSCRYNYVLFTDADVFFTHTCTLTHAHSHMHTCRYNYVLFTDADVFFRRRITLDDFGERAC